MVHWSMVKSRDIRRGRHCVSNLHVHLVFVSKYRRLVFQKKHYESMKTIFTNVCNDFEAQLVDIDGEDDHVHLVITYKPKTSIVKLVNSLKGVSSRLLRKEHPDISKHYWNGVLWSPSYFAASCGGAPIEIIRQYIEQQISPT